MGDKMIFCSIKLLEMCSDNNDLHEFMDWETRIKILRGGTKSAPQLIIKSLTNIIMDNILGSTLPKCSFPGNEKCNLGDVTLCTLKVLSYHGIKDSKWVIPFIEAAVCKLMENNSKHVMKENENIVVEYINRPPIKNVNPRSLLRKNLAYKRKYV